MKGKTVDHELWRKIIKKIAINIETFGLKYEIDQGKVAPDYSNLW